MVWRVVRVNGLAFGLKNLVLATIVSALGLYLGLYWLVFLGFAGIAIGVAESRLYRVYLSGDEIVVATIWKDASMRLGDIREIEEERCFLPFLGRKYTLIDSEGKRLPVRGVREDLISLLR